MPANFRLLVTLLAAAPLALTGPVATASPVAARAGLVDPASGRSLRACYQVRPPSASPAALGLQQGEILRADLSTRFDEALVQLAAQGLLNRSGPRLWLDNAPVGRGHGEETWRGYYSETRGWRFVPLGADFPAFLSRVAPAFGGMILYDQDSRTDQVFLALNLANVNGCLPVSRALYRQHHRLLRGLPVVARIPRDAFSREAIYRWLIAELLPLTDRSAAMSVRRLDGQPEQGPYQSLDYAFCRRCLIYDLAARDEISPADADLADAILARLKRPAYVLGWGDNEFEFCKRLSLRGHSWLATVSAPNLSFHATVKPLSPPPYPQDLQPRVQTPQKKLYLAFCANEGDTATVVTQLYYRGWNQPGRGQVPLSWALDPAWTGLVPEAVEFFNRTRTPLDTFVCPPSGAGYCYPQYMQPAHLRDHVAKTAALLRDGLPMRDVMLWQADSRPALEAFARLRGIRGLTLEHDVAAGVRIPVRGTRRSIPLLGFGGKQQYWITDPELMDAGNQVNVKGLIRYLDSLYDPAKLPQFVPFYGFVETNVNGLAELGRQLDPGRYEIVDLGTLFHLAGQVPAAPPVSATAPSTRWKAGTDRDLTAWSELLNGPLVSMTARGLRVEVPAGTTWALAAVPDLLLPRNARRLRFRVADLGGAEGAAWIAKCYGDFAGVGYLSHWLPVGFQSTAREVTVPLTPQVLAAREVPMRQFQVGVVGPPGSYVVFDRIDFIP